ncbi:MAG: hypothetical protein AVDCRST_MAG73-1892, partial [uncultured Thermomicrobiales bacterium]
AGGDLLPDHPARYGANDGPDEPADHDLCRRRRGRHHPADRVRIDL